MLRAMMPFVTIILLLVTASALVYAAATLVPAPPPMPAAPSRAETSEVRSEPAVDASVIQSVEVVLPPAAETIDLVRIIAEPASHSIEPFGEQVQFLTIESGTLTIDLDGPAHLLVAKQKPVGSDGQLRLDSGDGLVWPESTSVTWSNATRDPVVLLAVGIFPAAESYAPVGIAQDEGDTPTTRWRTMIVPGITLQPLASGWWGSMPAGPMDMTLWRTHVPFKDETTIPAMGEVMLTIEAGTASLRVEDGTGWQDTPRQVDQPITTTSAAHLVSGDGAVLIATSCVHIRNSGSGPLLLLGLTISPVAQHVSSPADPLEETSGWPPCPASDRT